MFLFTCDSCKVNEAQAEHTCPYAEELWEVCDMNPESLCNCCKECEQKCCDDI